MLFMNILSKLEQLDYDTELWFAQIISIFSIIFCIIIWLNDYILK